MKAFYYQKVKTAFSIELLKLFPILWLQILSLAIKVNFRLPPNSSSSLILISHI